MTGDMEAPAGAVVRRVERVAIKMGDDYHTLEQEIVVPVGASDALIAEATATGDRVHMVLHASMMEQVAALRAGALSAAQQPVWATAKQLGFLGRLRSDLALSDEEWAELCGRVQAPTEDSQMTRAQASAAIDALQEIQGQRRLMNQATMNGGSGPEATTEDIPF